MIFRKAAGALLLSLAPQPLPVRTVNPSPTIASPAQVLGSSSAPKSQRRVEFPEASSAPKEAPQIRGRVVAVDPLLHRLQLDLNGSLQWMDVDAASSEIYSTGALVRGFLREPSDALKRARLENIWPADPATESALAAGLQALQGTLQDAGARIGEGAPFPINGLLNQQAKVVHSADFEGKHLLVNFLYGRCADPEMCPATANRMAAVYEGLPLTHRQSVRIVFITLDPDFDTPARCLEYLRSRKMSTDGFSMLTGPKETLEGLFKLCSIRTERMGTGVIQHNQITFWINPKGFVQQTFPGAGISSEEIIESMSAALTVSRKRSDPQPGNP